MSEAVRLWQPGRPAPVPQLLAHLRHGAYDPTWRQVGEEVWRGIRTPGGPATLAVGASGGEVVARAWGTGAEWALAAVPRMLGNDDDLTGFAPRHRGLIRLRRQFPHWRLGATGLVLESLVPAIIEQKVTGREAFAGYRDLVRRYGEPAPGPLGAQGLRVPPTPAQLLAIPSWEWLKMRIDRGRSEPLLRAARVAGSLERAAGGGPAALDAALTSLPGIGVWTSAEVRARALGDADAVSFGDAHVSRDVGFALVGEPLDDGGLAELLEEYRPHRYRVQRLVELGGVATPRRGPRMAPRTHLPVTHGRAR